jgi:hypothetical protein
LWHCQLALDLLMALTQFGPKLPLLHLDSLTKHLDESVKRRFGGAPLIYQATQSCSCVSVLASLQNPVQVREVLESQSDGTTTVCDMTLFRALTPQDQAI